MVTQERTSQRETAASLKPSPSEDTGEDPWQTDGSDPWAQALDSPGQEIASEPSVSGAPRAQDPAFAYASDFISLPPEQRVLVSPILPTPPIPFAEAPVYVLALRISGGVLWTQYLFYEYLPFLLAATLGFSLSLSP